MDTFTCRHCSAELPVRQRWTHPEQCASNPENIKVTVTYPCGHSEERSQFPDDPDGSKLAELVEQRGVCPDCFIAQYRAAQANRSQERYEEHMAEMRAAFGPGTEVMNVITGERVRL